LSDLTKITEAIITPLMYCCMTRIRLQYPVVQGILERGCTSGRSSSSTNHVVRSCHGTQPAVGVMWIQLHWRS